MNESVRGALVVSARFAAVIACIALVVVAGTIVSWLSLLLMLAGLAGLVVVLALYNRRFR